MSHYVLFTGGRDVDGPDAEQAMEEIMFFLHCFYGVDLRVMHGGAPGVDTLAQQAADRHGVPTKSFPYPEGRGRAGGPERNRHMANLLLRWEQLGHSVEVIAFPGGRGTASMVRTADDLGLIVTHITLQEAA